MDRISSDAKKVLSVWLGKTAVLFGDVGRDRERRAIELIDQKTVVSGELFSLLADRISEVDRLLVNDQLFDGECHFDRQQ